MPDDKRYFLQSIKYLYSYIAPFRTSGREPPPPKKKSAKLQNHQQYRLPLKFFKMIFLDLCSKICEMLPKFS